MKTTIFINGRWSVSSNTGRTCGNLGCTYNEGLNCSSLIDSCQPYLCVY